MAPKSEPRFSAPSTEPRFSLEPCRLDLELSHKLYFPPALSQTFMAFGVGDV